jgi:hypothetical protein
VLWRQPISIAGGLFHPEMKHWLVAKAGSGPDHFRRSDLILNDNGHPKMAVAGM